MNNLQLIIKDDTRAAMHMAVELCEQGDFDSVTEAFRWLMQENESATQEKSTLTSEQVRELMEDHSHQYQSPVDAYVYLTEYDWQAIADDLNATLGLVKQ